MVKQGL